MEVGVYMNNFVNVCNNSRTDLEKIEEDTLAPYAIKSHNATRLYMDNYIPCNRRTEFERDKDRIIYSLAFKRLMEKTQVYVTNEGDHYTNRLSHTLEVTQIARSVASSLGLNSCLAESIALGHDLGHTPFGHAVENALKNKLIEVHQDGFEHNYQNVLVVDYLENKDFTNVEEAPYGINLTNYTRYGILHHTKIKDNVKAYRASYDDIAIGTKYKSLEAELVNKIDTIAYLFHDLEDAILNTKILQDMKLNDKKQFKNFLDTLNFYTAIACDINKIKYHPIKDLWEDYNSNTILKAMIKDLINGTQEQIKQQKIASIQDIQESKINIADFSKFKEHFKSFKDDFVTKYIYQSPIANQMDTKAQLIANRLYGSFLKKYEQLPYRTRELYNNAPNAQNDSKRKDDGYEITKERVIINYIAGMTDRYALVNYRRMFE